jgi:hypothetical protein
MVSHKAGTADVVTWRCCSGGTRTLFVNIQRATGTAVDAPAAAPSLNTT